MAEKMKVLNPRGLMNDIPLAPLSDRPADYSGKTIYMIESWGDKSGFDEIYNLFKEYMSGKYPGVKFLGAKRLMYASDDPVLWKDVREKADAFVYFGAPSCSTTAYTITWPARALERTGVPGVCMIYEYLEPDAKMSCEREGMNIRYVMAPYPYADIPAEDKLAIVKRLETALTAPVREDEKLSGIRKPVDPDRICFEGTEDEIQKYFYDNGWTDGLPIIPPTEERVAAMLAGTSHKPDEVVCTMMAPEGRKVTVEKVAVNGVMCGCDPSYMPVLLACCEIMGRNQRYHASTKSTNSFSYMQLVSGPIRNELGMNGSVYALGPGNRANATIGRFQRMALTNLGGAEVGINLMGVQGNVSSYTFCVPENEEASPWQPFGQSLGYGPEESVLSLFTGGFSHCGNFMFRPLENCTDAIKEFELLGGYTVFISPLRAKMLVKEGLDTREKAVKYFCEKTSMSVGELKRRGHWDRSIVRSIKSGRSKRGEEYLTYPDDKVVPSFTEDTINLIVLGDPAGSDVMQGWSLYNPDHTSIDKWR